MERHGRVAPVAFARKEGLGALSSRLSRFHGNEPRSWKINDGRLRTDDCTLRFVLHIMEFAILPSPQIGDYVTRLVLLKCLLDCIHAVTPNLDALRGST